MQIVIDIPDEQYSNLKNNKWFGQDISFCGESFASFILAGKPLPKGHGRIGDLSELETRIGNFIEHYNNLLKETNHEALVYMNHILDGIIDTDTIIEADKAESEDKE